jgi:hypothetical protein
MKIQTIALLLVAWPLHAQAESLKEHPLKKQLWNLQVVDMDTDGDKDVFGSFENLTWFENSDKKAQKLIERTLDSSKGSYDAAAVGDIDGDKDLDVVAAADGLHWWENLGKGKKWKKHAINAEFYASTIDIVDADGDGDRDILAARYRDGDISWFKNENGRGKWSDAQTVLKDAAELSSVVAADFDGDKDVDVLSVLYTEFVYVENAKGNWQRRDLRNYEFNVRPKTLATADMDGDGDLDCLAPDGYQVTIWENGGKGKFTLKDGAAWNVATHAVGGDFDGDGDSDIVVASGNPSDGVAFVENLGGGKFKKAKQLSKNWNSRALIAADLDGDGDQDIVGTSSDVDERGNRSAWFENQSKAKKT